MPYTALLQLQGNDLNESLQRGDVVYYSHVELSRGGRNHPIAGHKSKPTRLGVVTQVSFNNNQLTCSCPGSEQDTTAILAQNPYLFFSKDRSVNYSGIVGYFIEVE
mgnify:CR=1 FL=1